MRSSAGGAVASWLGEPGQALVSLAVASAGCLLHHAA
jgi:hypothetical protein